MFQTASEAKKRPKIKTLKSVRKWISPEKNFPREGKCVFLSLGKRKCVFLSLGKFFSWHFWGVFCMKRAGVGVACVFSTKMWGEVFSWARIETWPARREFHLKWKNVPSLIGYWPLIFPRGLIKTIWTFWPHKNNKIQNIIIYISLGLFFWRFSG